MGVAWAATCMYPIAAVPSTAATLRYRLLVRHLHQLGERAVGEILAELGRRFGIEHEIAHQLEEYAWIPRRSLMRSTRATAPPLVPVP